MSAQSLDKLVQLAPTVPEIGCKCHPVSVEYFQKRARAKYMTIPIIKELIALDSPLKRSYERTKWCGSVIEQTGNKVKSKYCNGRWCLVCNRIRTGKLINGYGEILNDFEDPQLVTLTIPNVSGVKLRDTITIMAHQFSLINRNLKERKGLRIKGLRKLECTHNLMRPRRERFHPHYHLIVDGMDVAIAIVGQWLKRFPKAVEDAQDIRPADKGSLKELCKYFTKIASKDTDFDPKAMDTMFRAISGKRVFQPYGIKKHVSEEVEELQSNIIDFQEHVAHRYWNWSFEVMDWLALDDPFQAFTGYFPSNEDLEFTQYINAP